MPAPKASASTPTAPAETRTPPEANSPAKASIPAETDETAEADTPAKPSTPAEADELAEVGTLAEASTPAEADKLAEVGTPAEVDTPAKADTPAEASTLTEADELAEVGGSAEAKAVGGGIDIDEPRRIGPFGRQAITLVIAAAVLAGFAAWAGLHASDLRASGGEANLALSDKALTKQVTSQVSTAVSTIFSYSYANPAATKQAAQRLLTGSAINQYNELFNLVEQKAPAERLVLHTTVTDLGVELLTSDRARLLVFVNQQDQAGSGQAVYSGAMFAVTAVRHGSHWLIGNINTFTSSG